MEHSLTALIAESLDIPAEDVTDDLSFQLTPEWNSIAHIELMVRLEEFLGVEIDGDRVTELTSVGAIRAFSQTATR